MVSFQLGPLLAQLTVYRDGGQQALQHILTNRKDLAEACQWDRVNDHRSASAPSHIACAIAVVLCGKVRVDRSHDPRYTHTGPERLHLQVSMDFLKLRLKEFAFSDADILFATTFSPQDSVATVAPVKTFTLQELNNSPVFSMTGFPLSVSPREVKLVLAILPGYKASAFNHMRTALVAYGWWESLEDARNARKVLRHFQMDPACAAAIKISQPHVWDEASNIPLPVITA